MHLEEVKTLPATDAVDEEREARKQRWARRLWWLHSFWALGAGTLVVIYAGRSYEHARWLILMLLAVWTLIVVFFRLFAEGRVETLKGRVGYLVVTYVLKNLYQGMLFFLLPFYWRSATLGTANQWFVAGLGLAAVVATLDLVFDNVLMRWRVLASGYFVVTLFAVINLAIPALVPAMPASWSLLIASVVSVAAFWTFHVPVEQLSRRRVQALFLLALAGAAGAGVVLRPIVPPVPHYVVRGAVSTAMASEHLREEATGLHADTVQDIYAQTRVVAPGGADSAFVHVWRHEGAEVLRIEPGYHTSGEDDPSLVTLTSRLAADQLPRRALGQWTVDVLTDDDRLVGRIRFRVYR